MTTDRDDDAVPNEAAQWRVDPSQDPNPGVPNHAAPDGAEVDPLIDLSRDPNPGAPKHAAPDEES